MSSGTQRIEGKKMDSKSALQRFVECGGYEEEDPIERLRFFCSLSMSGQDWIDVEQFIDDIKRGQS